MDPVILVAIGAFVVGAWWFGRSSTTTLGGNAQFQLGRAATPRVIIDREARQVHFDDRTGQRHTMPAERVSDLTYEPAPMGGLMHVWSNGRIEFSVDGVTHPDRVAACAHAIRTIHTA